MHSICDHFERLRSNILTINMPAIMISWMGLEAKYCRFIS